MTRLPYYKIPPSLSEPPAPAEVYSRGRNWGPLNDVHCSAQVIVIPYDLDRGLEVTALHDGRPFRETLERSLKCSGAAPRRLPAARPPR